MSTTQGMSADEQALIDELDANGDPKDELDTSIDQDEDEDTTAAAPSPAGDDTDEDESSGNAAAEPPAAGPAPAPEPAPAPFVPEVPADAKERLDAIKAEHDAAFDKLIEGTLEPSEYRAIKDRTEAEADALKEQMLAARIFTQQAEANARNEWQRAQVATMAEAKAEGLDYAAKPALMAAYNVHLKALGANPANEDKNAAWFLTEAHRLTKEDLGIKTRPRSDPRRGTDLSAVPPTLRNTPAAADPNIAGDEFAHLGNLEGVALEKAVAKMTPEQQERWLG